MSSDVGTSFYLFFFAVFLAALAFFAFLAMGVLQQSRGGWRGLGRESAAESGINS